MDKIFIQIASFRDQQLIPTINDLIEKAKFPERLTFGIVGQYAEEDKGDNIDHLFNKENFSILKIHYSKSPGLGGARSETQKMGNGEKYTLQIDSHMRFLKNGDEELILMMKKTEAKKPIISTYATMYDPDNDYYHEGVYKINPDHFTDRETIYFRPQVLQEFERPVPSSFVSGHFFFTLGLHCKEYKYNPDLFFTGDEISLATRSFTLGYDIYRPNKAVVGHYYIRKNSNRTFGIKGENLQIKSKKILKELWNGDYSGEYGFGNKRTLKEGENFSGICMKTKSIHKKVFTEENPPFNLEEETNGREKYKSIEYNFEIDGSNIHNDGFENDLKYIAFIFLTKEEQQSFRIDVYEENILKGSIQKKYFSFLSSLKPISVKIGPMTTSKIGLQNKIIDLNEVKSLE